MMLKLGQYSIYNCDPIVLTQLACFVGRYWDFVDSLNLFKQLHLLDTNFCLVRYARWFLSWGSPVHIYSNS